MIPEATDVVVESVGEASMMSIFSAVVTNESDRLPLICGEVLHPHPDWARSLLAGDTLPSSLLGAGLAYRLALRSVD
jgi:hypothetical protein